MNIVLDPGHSGPIEPGAVGPKGTLECDVVLKVAQQVKQLMVGHGVLLTRDGNIDDVDLSWRPAMADDADVFVSIHCNAFKNSSAHGSEAWIPTNASKRSEHLADLMCEELEKITECDRGVKVMDFTVIHNAVPPAVLVELEFISNEEGEQSLKDTMQYAKAISEALTRWGA